MVEVGWAGLQNGELLRRAAEAGFAGFITMDRNLQYQQNSGRLTSGIVLLRAPNNRVETVLPLVSAVLIVLGQLRPGTVVEVGA